MRCSCFLSFTGSGLGWLKASELEDNLRHLQFVLHCTSVCSLFCICSDLLFALLRLLKLRGRCIGLVLWKGRRVNLKTIHHLFSLLAMQCLRIAMFVFYILCCIAVCFALLRLLKLRVRWIVLAWEGLTSIFRCDPRYLQLFLHSSCFLHCTLLASQFVVCCFGSLGDV